MDPQVEWRAPEGIADRDFWTDPAWRDLDASTTMLLRAQVVRRLEEVLAGRPTPPTEGTDLGGAVLALSALSIGLAAGRRRKKKGR